MAATVGKGFVDIHAVTMTVVFAGLIGAIGWNLLTWYFGLPSSSSHALIGGLVGAVWAAQGSQQVSGSGLLDKLIVPGGRRAADRVRRRRAVDPARLPDRRPAAAGAGQPRLPPRPARLERPARALARHQRRAEDDGPDHAGARRPRLDLGQPLRTSRRGWSLASATAIALGTFSGGWRIIRTMGSRIIKMDPPQGFAAQTRGSRR